ncbi:MAG: hypothetical protein DME36_14280 [Verrucomicrobia bacterium]|nr:MAG: hypothetical protein DME36_14280 [Verrucomicrobiota bacterium]
MSVIYQISFALLWAIVVLEAILLEEILRMTVRFKRLHLDFRSKAQQLSIGDRAPQFTARLLGTNQLLKSSKFRGSSTTLLFVSPEEADSPLYRNLSAAIHGMWHRDDGKLYLVCSGREDDCRRVISDHHVDGFEHGQVPVILDEGGEIARRFLIGSTPQGVMLDEKLRVSRYGRPLLTEEPDHAETEKRPVLA